MTYGIFLLFAAATTIVFVEGSIFQFLRGPENRAREQEPLLKRLFRDLVSCALCSGVWIGWGWALLLGERDPLTVFGLGPLTGAAAMTLKLFWDFLECRR